LLTNFQYVREVKAGLCGKVWFHGLWFDVWPGVYQPAEDTFMLAEAATALEIGTGCGLVSIMVSRSGCPFTVGTDISLQAIRCARHNALRLAPRIHLVLCDLASPLRGRFDLVSFNPPYLISEPNLQPDAAIDGGPDGRRLIDRFLPLIGSLLSARGRALMIQSSLNDVEKTVKLAERLGLEATILQEQSFFFERLYLLQFRRDLHRQG